MSRIARLIGPTKRAEKAPLAIAHGGARVELFELTQRKRVSRRVEIHDEERRGKFILSHFPKRLKRAMKLQRRAFTGAAVPVLVQLSDDLHFARRVFALGWVAL